MADLMALSIFAGEGDNPEAPTELILLGPLGEAALLLYLNFCTKGKGQLEVSRFVIV